MPSVPSKNPAKPVPNPMPFPIPTTPQTAQQQQPAQRPAQQTQGNLMNLRQQMAQRMLQSTMLGGWPNLLLIQSKIAGEVHETTKASGRTLIGNGIIGVVLAFIFITVIGVVVLGPSCPKGQVCPMTPAQAQNIHNFLVGDLIFFGAIFIYIGFGEFSKEQVLMATPVAKIDGASYGLNEITGRLTPEGANQPITTPLSRTASPYYLFTIYTLVERGSGKSRHVEVMTLGKREHGVPSLLTDGTGYLAPDMANTNLSVLENSYAVEKDGKALSYIEGFHLNEGAVIGAFNEFKAFIADQFGSSVAPDLTKQSQYQFRQMWNKKILEVSPFGAGRNPGGQVGCIYISEIYVPMDQDYFGIGLVSTSDKLIGGKPVKLMGVDPKTKILEVALHSKRQEFGRLKEVTLATFVMGAACAIAGIALGVGIL